MRSSGLIVPVALVLTGSASAQEFSRDRAELDAAAGRQVFENVLIADPLAFSSRTPAQLHARSVARLEAPAPTGEAAADRAELDAASGRRVYASTARATPEPQRNADVQGSAPRRVRVVLPSPYGR
jgi:hypothetical protein